MLKTYLQALLSRFYSKKDSAEVIALRDVNVTPITLKDESINGASDVSVVAPASGRIVSYVNNNTGYNGLSYPGNMVTLISTFNPELINNTAMTFEVAKGQTFFVHRKTSSPTPCRVLLFPFNGGGVNSILNPILQGGLLCLRNTCKLYLIVSCESLTRLGLFLMRQRLHLAQQLLAIQSITIPHQLTELFKRHYGSMVIKVGISTTKDQRLNFLVVLLRIIGGGLAYRLKRGIQYRCTQEREEVIHTKSVSSLSTPTVSLSFGGALC